jgi:hypothetical protein
MCDVPGIAVGKQQLRPVFEYRHDRFAGAAGFDLLRDFLPGFS